MALKDVWVDIDHYHSDRILVTALADCPLRQLTRCDGSIELSFEYIGEHMARWGKDEERSAPCDKCGCMLGLNSSMLSEALKEATRKVKLRGYTVPELTNEPRLKVEVLTNLPPEYVGRDYLILVQVNCQMLGCKGKTVFSCHLLEGLGEGLVFSQRGSRQGCEICGTVSQLTVAQISQVVKEARRQLAGS